MLPVSAVFLITAEPAGNAAAKTLITSLEGCDYAMPDQRQCRSSSSRWSHEWPWVPVSDPSIGHVPGTHTAPEAVGGQRTYLRPSRTSSSLVHTWSAWLSSASSAPTQVLARTTNGV